MEQVRARALEGGYQRVLRPVLFRVGGGDAEAAHELTLRAVGRLGRHRGAVRAVRAVLGATAPGAHRAGSAGAGSTEVAGIRFPGVVGLAAGVDKNGVGLQAWGSLGFGYAELGTVTARAQPGNPAPRLFRLPESGAIINRMGFNNDGASALATRLRVARGRGAVDIPIGVSIGKTRSAPVQEATEDYLTSVRLLDGLADYLAVNVSSPNTPGLRSLQDAGPLRELLTAIVLETRVLGQQRLVRPTPVFLKLAPDLTDSAIDDALQVATDAGVSGIIATNTTTAREGVAAAEASLAQQAGGLSGAPLTERSREVVRHISRHTPLPVIGVGGIMTGQDALRMLDAGASLVQVYTGYVYRGPALVAEVNAARRRAPVRQ